MAGRAGQREADQRRPGLRLLYLAAAASDAGIAEFDEVDELSDLQRQAIHGQSDVQFKGDLGEGVDRRERPTPMFVVDEECLDNDNVLVDLFEDYDLIGYGMDKLRDPLHGQRRGVLLRKRRAGLSTASTARPRCSRHARRGRAC